MGLIYFLLNSVGRTDLLTYEGCAAGRRILTGWNDRDRQLTRQAGQDESISDIVRAFRSIAEELPRKLHYDLRLVPLFRSFETVKEDLRSCCDAFQAEWEKQLSEGR